MLTSPAPSLKWDVLGIGCAAVDDLLFVEAYPPADVKTRVQKFDRQGGGLTATALIASARLGAKTAFGGQLGFDEYSAFTAEYMEVEGIDLAPSARRPEAAPFHSVIIIDTANGTRNIFSRQAGEVGATAEHPTVDELRAARVLLMDHHSGPGKVRVATAAREANIPIVGDIERPNVPDFEPFFDLVDHLVVSRQFAAERTGLEDPPAILRALHHSGRHTVVLTMGSGGSYALEEGEILHVPAFPTKVVDTTGCGDTFHGAYAATLAWGFPLEERLRYASAAASLKAGRPGAQTGIPTRAAVEAFLASQD